MYQTVSRPLPVYLALASQTEPTQALIAVTIAEQGLDHEHVVTINGFARRTVDPVLHPGSVVGWPLVLQGKADLAASAFTLTRDTRVVHATVLLGAVGTAAGALRSRLS